MKRILVLAVVLPACLVACAKGASDEAKEETPKAEVTAEIVTVQPQRFVETIDALGVVAARAGHVAAVTAPGPTRVTGVRVSPGARVSKGDVLVDLERPPFESAARSADAALAAAQSAADRAKRLADAGVLPRKDAEQAAAELAQANAAAQAAHRVLDLSVIRSPIDGIVTQLSAVIGAGVDVGQPLVDVTDINAIDINLTLSIADARRVAVGQSVAIHPGTGDADAAIAAGRVADVSRVVDTASLGVMTRVEIVSGMAAVRLGESLRGRITVGEHARAIVVPAEALVPDGEAFKVFVVDTGGFAHSRAVLVGGRSDTGAWIKTGLNAGERVVAHGAYGVSDSAKVVTGKEPADEEKPAAGGKPPEKTPPPKKAGKDSAEKDAP
ncbi:MAG TPA: efflux RND transporter periplasmic adaptor subunit [Gemmatimonadaceae bacterium]|nr:efflux RND transporter periplasmic adaptor subunit [Gemmatimonadaceae bacterium]